MHRIITFLTAAVLSLVALGVGAFAADLPFWQRAFELPLPPDGAYLPVATLGNAEAAPLAAVSAAESRFDPASVEAIAARARNAGSRALLVMQRGRLQIERYFAADDEHTLLPAALIARPLTAMALGTALADGRIRSLDTPVAAYLGEWDDEARGKIKLRQLLEETSGLETGGDIAGLAHRSPWAELAALPSFATSRGVRMLLGNDFESTALGFSLDHEPGGFYNVSPANAQLAAVIVERVTDLPFEEYVDRRLWKPLGAGRAEMQLDRRAGMPAAHCCWRASARDVLRVANLIANDGLVEGKAILPAGWVHEMARPSRVNAETGMELNRGVVGGLEVLSAADDTGSTFWVIPARALCIVNIAGPGGGPIPELPTLLLAALHGN
jgi:CubicO group peptidase (beta-lactamase class C family)